MFGEQSAELSLNCPAKSVAAVQADRVEARFLVGGCSVQDGGLNNQVHVVRYHSDVNVVAMDAALPHPTGPIEKLVTSPQDRTLVLTLAERATQATLYRLPPQVMEASNELILDSDTTGTEYGGGYDYDGTETSQSTGANSLQGGNLEQKLVLESSAAGAKIQDMAWRETSEDEGATPGDVLTIDDQGMVTQWDVSLGTAESMRSLQATSEECPPMNPPKVVWDPHQPTTVAVSWKRSVKFLDTRAEALGEATPITAAHRYGVTDLDYNPNKPYTLATSGLDGIVHYWDTRTTRRPLLTSRGGHSHYAWSVHYNPFHDQLVLSTGTDAVVNLWRVSTISSAPLLTLEDTPRGSPGDEAPNVRVSRQELSESVYGAAWSAADAWQYMTVTYDGRVALHHVPSKEKYKILL